MQTKHQGVDGLVDVVLAASRVLAGLAAQSLPESADVTMHQFRALVVLHAHGELNVNSLAELLGVSPSTATRLCDRLVRKRLIQRHHARENRREVCLSVSPEGAALVAQVMGRRRAAIAAILANMGASRHRELAGGLRSFLEASGKQPDAPWHLG